MKRLTSCLILSLQLVVLESAADIEDFQSDAFSVEEMCAYKAQQYRDMNYFDAYQDCLKANREEPTYASFRPGAAPMPSDEESLFGREEKRVLVAKYR